MKNSYKIRNITRLILSCAAFCLFQLGLQGQVSQLEFQALVALYSNTGGDNWTDNTGWDINGSAENVTSSWYGLTVTDGKVVSIDLSSNSLDGTITSKISNFTDLQYLNLSNNQLTGTVPATAGQLTMLQTLYLDNNQLSGDLDATVNINSLTDLRIQNNSYTFAAIEPNLSKFTSSTYYQNQANFGLNKSTILYTEGQTLSLDATQLANVDLGGTNNRYQWYRNGTPLGSSSSPLYSVTNVAYNDFGTYYCEVTNTQVSTTINSEIILVGAPMYYVQSRAYQNAMNIESGATNQVILRYEVEMYGNVEPKSVTKITAKAEGTTDINDIIGASLYYTGSNPNFSTGNQFGSSVSDASVVMSFSDNELMSNGINYFWLVYNINALATSGNSIDGAITSIKVNGATKTPATPAPEGARMVYNPAGSFCGTATDMGPLTIGETWTSTTINDGIRAVWGFSATEGMKYEFLACGTGWGNRVRIYDADRNQVANQYSYNYNCSSTSPNLSWTCPSSGNYYVLLTRDNCNTLIGSIDNTVTLKHRKVQPTQMKVNVVSVTQNSSDISAQNNQYVIKIAVETQGELNPLSLNQLNLSTSGTTNASADLMNAKVYYTGSSNSFSTGTQVGSTINMPAGGLTFYGSQTLNEGMNYFWLAYDLSNNPTANNMVDGACNNVVVSGNSYTPTVQNPAGARIITQKAVSIQTNQIATTGIMQGSDINPIVRVDLQVVGVAGAQPKLNSITIQSENTNDGDIKPNGVRLYGTDNTTFSTSYPIGQPTSFVNGQAVFSGLGVDLPNGYRYLWVTYDISDNAVDGDVLDASISANAINVSGGLYPGSNQSPSGNGYVGYCTSNATYEHEGIVEITLNTLTNNTAGESSCGGLEGRGYFDYTHLSTNLVPGNAYSLSITLHDCSGSFLRRSAQLYIDWNRDGDFADAGENIYNPGPTNTTQTYTTTINVPAGAELGSTRMRVISYLPDFSSTPSSCGTYDYGETEDYSINIKPESGYMAISSVETGIASSESIDLSVATTDQEIIKVKIVADGAKKVQSVSSMGFTTSGTTDVSNLLNAKVYYTGSSASFGTGAQFGATKASPDGFLYFTGDQALVEGDNYFWLAYDIDPGAFAGNLVDATCSQVTINSNQYVPSPISPEGSREIALHYCDSYGTTYSMEWIDYVGLGSISNSTGGSSYTDYTSSFTPEPLTANGSYNVIVSMGLSGTWTEVFSIWIDYNRDGVFSQADGELITQFSDNNAATMHNIPFTVPASIVPGPTVMRVQMKYSNWTIDPCEEGFSYGEVEDYPIILGPTAPVVNSLGEEFAETVLAEEPVIYNGAIKIYPNPSDGIFKIKKETGKCLDLSVYNLNGAKVYTKMLDTDVTDIDLRAVGKGMFILQFEDEGEIYMKRILIE